MKMNQDKNPRNLVLDDSTANRIFHYQNIAKKYYAPEETMMAQKLSRHLMMKYYQVIPDPILLQKFDWMHHYFILPGMAFKIGIRYPFDSDEKDTAKSFRFSRPNHTYDQLKGSKEFIKKAPEKSFYDNYPIGITHVKLKFLTGIASHLMQFMSNKYAFQLHLQSLNTPTRYSLPHLDNLDFASPSVFMTDEEKIETQKREGRIDSWRPLSHQHEQNPRRRKFSSTNQAYTKVNRVSKLDRVLHFLNASIFSGSTVMDPFSFTSYVTPLKGSNRFSMRYNSDLKNTNSSSAFGREIISRYLPSSPVLIHTDAMANAAANTLNADAVTLGRDIFFAAGKFNLSQPGGVALMGHELLHTRQYEDFHGKIPPTEHDAVERQAVTTEMRILSLINNQNSEYNTLPFEFKSRHQVEPQEPMIMKADENRDVSMEAITPGQTPATTPSSLPTAPEIDTEQIALQVYAIIERKLREEKEMRGE